MNCIHPNDRVYARERALAAAAAQGEDRDLVLVPVSAKAGVPVRMRRPTKDACRQWLAKARELVDQLQAEFGDLRAGSCCRPSSIRP
jgi:hypothetical protein